MSQDPRDLSAVREAPRPVSYVDNLTASMDRSIFIHFYTTSSEKKTKYSGSFHFLDQSFGQNFAES